MHNLMRLLAVVCLVSLAVGPASVATASAQTTTAPAPTSGQITGVATDANGALLSGVVITVIGAGKTTSATTAADGTYSVDKLAPGIYEIRAQRSGFGSASSSDLVVIAGSQLVQNVTLSAQTLSSLQTIGKVSTTNRRSAFNTSPASVQVVDQQAFVDQQQVQVQRILDQTPGVVVDHPGTSATNASPGAITFPSIRGGLGFETASLIDGHPLAVGNFGDYVTTFLNADTLQGFELIKGPGSAAPNVNYAIGGTINFRTLDPSPKTKLAITMGKDSFGGDRSNYLFSGNTLNGKLGFVLDYALYGSPGPLKDSPNPITLSAGTFLNCNQPTAALAAANCPAKVGTTLIAGNNPNIQNNVPYAGTTLVACCQVVNQNYNSKTELAKLRLNLSSASSFTASFLGSQTYTDQNGNHVYQYPTTFTPGAGYINQTVAAGSTVQTYQNVFLPNSEWEINNEPIFQGEFHTTFKGDNILARYYTASINRLQYNGVQTASFVDNETYNLYGTTAPTVVGGVTVAPGQVFNGTPVQFSQTGTYFRSAEEDKLHGFSFQYDHNFGDSGNTLSFSAEDTASNTYAYDYSGSGNTPSVPAGSRQDFTTFLLRGVVNITPQLNLTLSNYYDRYFTRFTADGGLSFQSNTVYRDDARAGLVYRPNSKIALRASAGSAIAPPYLNLLDRVQQSTPLFQPGALFATQSINSGNLKPETTFGVDIGGDFRLSDDNATVLTVDLYRTNLFNQFLSTTSGGAIGLACPSVGGYSLNAAGQCISSTGAAAVAGTATTIYQTGVRNLANARYEGVEIGFKRDPSVGFGFIAQGALLRAYPVNVNPCIYSTTFQANGQLDCTKQNTNLAVVPGINYQNSSNGFNSVSNHAEPYSQGYGDLHVRTANGGYLSLGVTYYGANNSLNVNPFFLLNASARIPLEKSTFFNIGLDNINNAYSNAYITPYSGTTVPLVNGKGGLTHQNVIGPRQARFSITHAFDLSNLIK